MGTFHQLNIFRVITQRIWIAALKSDRNDSIVLISSWWKFHTEDTYWLARIYYSDKNAFRYSVTHQGIKRESADVWKEEFLKMIRSERVSKCPNSQLITKTISWDLRTMWGSANMTFYPGAAFLRFYVILSQNFWDFKAQEYDFFDHFFAEICNGFTRSTLTSY